VDVANSFHQHQAVGRHHITLKKAENPSRWRFLHSERTYRPDQLRIWKTVHEKNLEKVYDHYDPPSSDFEGHEWKSDELEDYEEF
jgi:hypothetical protein